MKEQLQKRLNELRSEFESGQKALAELEHRQAELRNTLMRISGAIQVLEEELGKYNSTGESSQPSQVEIVEPIEAETEPETG